MPLIILIVAGICSLAFAIAALINLLTFTDPRPGVSMEAWQVLTAKMAQAIAEMLMALYIAGVGVGLAIFLR